MTNDEMKREMALFRFSLMNCTDWNEFHSLEDVNDSYHDYLDREYNNHQHSSMPETV